MVSLLTAQHLNVLVLFDDEKQARTIKEEIMSSKLIREENIIFVSEAIVAKKPSEADIEDLISSVVYENLVRECYARELKGKTLKLNPKIPRIVKRFEAGFNELGITFHKTRPAGLFFRRMATDPASLMPPETVQCFQTLFSIINERLQKSVGRGASAFH